ncbi:MAG: hypothetical protein QXT53_08565 [Ignisphaera sp.]
MTGNGGSVAKKAIDGLSIWFVASSVLLGLSASIVGSSVRGSLMAAGITNFLFNVLLVLFGVVGLLISATLIYNILCILRRYGLLPSPYNRIHGLDEEETIHLIKDVISLYRGYRWYIVLVGIVLTITGVVLIALILLAVKEGVSGGIDAILFRFVVATIYLGYGVLDLYLERRTIFRRLARAKQIENVLSKSIK